MQEIGQGSRAFLFCISTNCVLNDDQALPMQAELAIEKGRAHDKLGGGGESVVVRFDEENPLSVDAKAKVSFLTGMHLG